MRCTSFAAVEITTARAVIVNQKSADGKVMKPAPIAVAATPPPFRQPAPVIVAAAISNIAARKQDAAPFPSPLPELEERVFNHDLFMEEEVVPAYLPNHKPSQLRAVLAIGAVMTALAVTASYGSDWLARSRESAEAAPSAATALATPIKRAQAAAKRMEPVQAPEAIPAAPLSGALASAEIKPAPAPRDVRDTIQSSSMAPTRARPDEPAPLFLQARKQIRTMELRTGPGPSFPVLGFADLNERYPVVEWKDRWFKIQLEETPGLTAWVAYERIELFSEDKDLAEEAFR